MGEARDSRGREAGGASSPVAAGPDADRPSWVRDHKWAFGGILAVAALGGGLWWRRRRRIRVEPVSEQWLRQREYDAGQRETG